MICAGFVYSPAASAVILTDEVTQHADTSECEYVVLQGTDTSAIHMFSFPSAADASAAFAWAFTLVVGSYLFAWGAGAVLNFIRSDRDA